MIFSFGQSEHERIAIDVVGYERPTSGDYDDDNWVVTQIEVRIGGFKGKARAALRTTELVEFGSQLRTLHETLSGTAEFTTLEGQLHLQLEGDGKGHINLKGEVMDQAGVGNRLHFSLEFDQSRLADSVRDLDAVISKFPVRSR